MHHLRTLAAGGLILSLLFLTPGDIRVQAQNRMAFSIVTPDLGHVALGLAIRRLGVSGTFMQAPAHPDDEHNALFALFTRGMGLRSVDVQANRGDGGQNEIGPELFQDIAVLRTSELLSAHRIDGAEQYFTRAIDYGYSFDPQEVINKWGRTEIVGDFVRLMRTLRPDVVLTMNIQGRGGDRAHEATAVLVREAYFAAGDPAKYPEQLKEGLHPWQPKKLYFNGGAGVIGAGGRAGGAGGRGGAAPAAPTGARLTRVDTAAYDPLLGRTYAEIGADAHSYHKCQGTTGLPALPGFATGRGGGGAPVYQLMDSKIPGEMERDETSLFDGIDTSLAGLAHFAGATPPAALTAGLAAIAGDAQRAQQAFAAGNDAGTAAPIEAGLTAVRALRAVRNRFSPRPQGARLRRCRPRRARAVVRRGRRRWSGDRVGAREALAARHEPRRLRRERRQRRDRGLRQGVHVRARTGEARGRVHLQRHCVGAAAREAHDALFSRRLLEDALEPGDRHLRSGRAVRRAVPTDAVPRDLPCEGRNGGRHQGIAGRVPLRQGHLSRRQAHGAERRAVILGESNAAACGRAVDGVGPAGRRHARDPRGGDQQYQDRH
jgi:hypothetical protein